MYDQLVTTLQSFWSTLHSSSPSLPNVVESYWQDGLHSLWTSLHHTTLHAESLRLFDSLPRSLLPHTISTEKMAFDFLVISLGSFFFHQCLFWLHNVPLIFLDVVKQPAFLYKYKIQKNIVTLKEYLLCISLVLCNQLLIMFPASFILGYFVVAYMPPIDSPLPNLVTLIRDVICCILTEEVTFYYSHRLLHTPYFYGRIHKLHHYFKYPIGIASEYAHPVEFIFSNIVPFSMGPIIFKIHPFSMMMWFFIAITGTIHHHCGFAFPWLLGSTSPDFHDFHHYAFNCNFGLLGWLDAFHGTDKLFKEAIKKKQLELQTNKQK